MVPLLGDLRRARCPNSAVMSDTGCPRYEAVRRSASVTRADVRRLSLSTTVTMWATLAIMPRTEGVSSSVDVAADPVEAQAHQGGALVVLAADRAAGLADGDGLGFIGILALLAFDGVGDEAPSARRPMMSPTFLPRLEAIWRGERLALQGVEGGAHHVVGVGRADRLGRPRPARPGFPAPRASDRRRSRRCREAPRAASPCPRRDGPAPSWCRVRLSRSGTRIMVFLASSVALRMASGTSRALP